MHKRIEADKENQEPNSMGTRRKVDGSKKQPTLISLLKSFSNLLVHKKLIEPRKMKMKDVGLEEPIWIQVERG